MILRVGADQWDDDGPYYISLVAIEQNNDTVLLEGLDKPIRPSHWRAIKQWASDEGFSTIRFRRKRAGKELIKTVQLQRTKE